MRRIFLVFDEQLIPWANVAKVREQIVDGAPGPFIGPEREIWPFCTMASVPIAHFMSMIGENGWPPTAATPLAAGSLAHGGKELEDDLGVDIGDELRGVLIRVGPAPRSSRTA